MYVTNSKIAAEIFKKHLTNQVEEFWILALNSNLKIIKIDMLFRGTADKCLVHPRDIFKFACFYNATSIIISHNHPSGDHSPSPQDIELTQRLVKIGQMIEIPIIDHIIVSETGFSSLSELGHCKNDIAKFLN